MKTDNELIAEFMGWKTKIFEVYSGKGEQQIWFRPGEDFPSTYLLTAELEFHTSWTWLMPVVEKIESISSKTFKYDIDEIRKGKWPDDKQFMDVIALPLATPMDEVHKAIVKFLKWYNLKHK